MRLSDTFRAIRFAELLPAFATAVAIAFLVGALASGIVVWKLQEGRAAINENAQLRADSKAWGEIAEGQRQQHAEQSIELGAAIERLSAISQGREDDREELRKWQEEQSAALDELRRQRPDLVTVDLGPEFLRHWNAANSGTINTAAPAAQDPRQPAPGVPAVAPAEQQQPVRDPGAARPGSGPGARLQGEQGASGRCRGRMGNDGLAVVLQGSCRDWNEGEGLPA